MLPFELPTAINIGRGSLFVSLFAGLFVCLDEAWVFKNMGDVFRTSFLKMKFRKLSEVVLFACCGDVFPGFVCSLFSFFLCCGRADGSVL